MGLVQTAADYKCRLVVFPEYFTVQLLTLGSLQGPMAEQVRHLATQEPRFCELMGGLARKHGLYIAAGTIPTIEGDRMLNRCHFFTPAGTSGIQGKLYMTRFEKEEWHVSPSNKLRVFETDFGRLAISICYDVEFPEVARAAAKEGAVVLLVPSCTDDRQGFLRVRYCAHARAIENQMFVIQSSTVGSLPMVPTVSMNYGQASILTPSDFPFSRDGILAEGQPNLEMMVIGEIDLDKIREGRENGTVLSFIDHLSTPKESWTPEVVTL